jgi:hypothetical protein
MLRIFNRRHTYELATNGNNVLYSRLFFNGPGSFVSSANLLDTSPVGKFFTFLRWFIAVPSAHGMILDNGALRVYNSKSTTSTLLYDSGTSDGSVPTNTLLSENRFEWFVPSDLPVVSSNGLYLVRDDPDQPNSINVMINSVNSDAMQTNCSFAGRQSDCYGTFETQYCDNILTGSTGFNKYADDRCICFDSELILASIFNIEVLKQNPVTYNQLLAVAPCITSVCTPYKTENNITGQFLNNVIECANEITICTSILTLGDDAQINGDVVSSMDCSNLDTGCSSGCPLGSVCNTSTNLCATTCTSVSQCTSTQKCDFDKGFCVHDSSGGGGGGGGGEGDDSGLSTGALVGIVVGAIVFVVAMILIGLWKAGKLTSS